MKTCKWGILGTGRIARTFAEALKGCDDAELCAVASRSIDKAESFAKEFGFEKAYGSYADLAADGDIDVVYIATPMSAPFEDAMLCLNSGRNVLCEKSAAMNSAELEKMLALADKKGLFFMEAMWMKCRPAYLKALEWAKSGRIGKVEYVKADFCNLVPYDPHDRLFAPQCGGGAMLDLAVYPLTLAADFLGGEPEEIICCGHFSRGIDMSNSIMLKYDHACACVNSGFEQPCRNNALVSGDNGFILFGDWFFCSCEVTLYDKNGTEVERCNIPNEINGYEYEIREVHSCLERGLTQSRLVPHSSTVSVMKMMDSCFEQLKG